MAVFDSQNRWFKNKIGPIEKGQSLHLKLRLEKEGTIQEVKLVLFRLGTHKELKIPMKKLAEEEAFIYSVECSFRQTATYDYYFEFIKNQKKYFVRRNWGDFKGKVTTDLKNLPWRLTVYEEIKTHPLMKKGIMYQIFPDRFWKGETEAELPKDRIYREWGELPYYDNRISQDFFGGNSNGIAEKLDYLKKLYVKAIYSNPIEWSSKNHRYAAIDYKQIDPVFGTEEEFIELIELLHRNGMIFIKDSVLNHVGSDSIYFDKEDKLGTNGAYNHENSPYRDWFYFYQNENGQKDYADWWGDKGLPKLNYSSESLNEYIFGKDGVIRYWFKKWKIDGVREDVADELSNGSREKIYEIAKEETGDKVIVIPEVWEDASCKYAYDVFMEYLQGRQATSTMNYPIRDTLLPYIRYGGDWAVQFKNVSLEIFRENYPKEVANSLMNFLSTHDTVRAITKLAGPEKDDHSRQWQAEHNTLSSADYRIGRERLLVAYTNLFFLPGIPSIYYGDEVGMQGMADPFCRACFPWDRIDKITLRTIRRLCKSYTKESESSDFLSEAEYDVPIAEERLLVYERKLENKALYVCSNFGDEAVDITKLFTEVVFNGDQSEEIVREPEIIFQVKQKKKDNVVKTYTEKVVGDGEEKEVERKKIILSARDAIVFVRWL